MKISHFNINVNINLIKCDFVEEGCLLIVNKKFNYLFINEDEDKMIPIINLGKRPNIFYIIPKFNT
jgi:hypothetical protein